MRTAVRLIVFGLLTAALLCAQTPAGAGSNQPTVSQTQNNTSAAPAQGQTQQPATPQNEPAQNSQPQYNQPQYNQSTQPANNQQNQQPYNQQNDDRFGRRAEYRHGDIPAGTEIRATLDTPLSTKTSHPGDRFTATVSDSAQGLPAGARIEGEVSEAEEGKTLPALRGRGKLNLRFRDVVMPDGQTLPLTATLVSVNNTNGKNTKRADNEGEVQSSTKGTDVAKDVGIGAGIGTVAGLIFGGPLKGLAIGAIAGGGYVLATNGKDVNLPAQTGMVIRLDTPMSLSGSWRDRDHDRDRR